MSRCGRDGHRGARSPRDRAPSGARDATSARQVPLRPSPSVEPAGEDRPRRGHVFARGPSPEPGTSRIAGTPVEPGMADEEPERLGPDLALAEVLVPVPICAESDLRVVEVDAGEPVRVRSSGRARGRRRRRPRSRRGTGRPRRTGAGCRGTRPSRWSPPAAAMSGGELVERPPDRAARAGGVLEEERARSRRRGRRPPRRAPRAVAPRQAAITCSKPSPRWLPTWTITPEAAIAEAATRFSTRQIARTLGEVGVGRREVDEVGRVAEGRFGPASRHCCAAR